MADVSSDRAHYLEWTYPGHIQGDNTLDDSGLAFHCPLDNGRHKIEPKESLGRLDTLPLETLTNILSSLDVPSLTVFRRVNQRGMQVVDSVLPYQRIMEHCPDIIRATLSVKASHFDLKQLDDTLFTRQCKICGRFGDYLALLSCTRVCMLCVRSKPASHPTSINMAVKCGDFDEAKISHIPHVVGIPGRYGPKEVASAGRDILYDWALVDKSVYGSQVHSAPADALLRARTLSPHYRYMTVVSAPLFYSSPSFRVEWGVHCVGCIGGEELAIGRHWRIKYAEDEYAAHIAQQGGVLQVKGRWTHEIPASALRRPPTPGFNLPNNHEEFKALVRMFGVLSEDHAGRTFVDFSNGAPRPGNITTLAQSAQASMASHATIMAILGGSPLNAPP